MVEDDRSPRFSDQDLARALDALSNPVRLAILRALEEPRCLSDIGVSPANDGRWSTRPGEILSRQTVKQHLDRLASAGIIVANKVPRRNGESTQYVVNPSALARIAQACQDLARVLAQPRLPIGPPRDRL